MLRTTQVARTTLTDEEAARCARPASRKDYVQARIDGAIRFSHGGREFKNCYTCADGTERRQFEVNATHVRCALCGDAHSWPLEKDCYFLLHNVKQHCGHKKAPGYLPQRQHLDRLDQSAGAGAAPSLDEARACQASFAPPPPPPPRRCRTIDHATVVPPVEGAPRRFVGVSWDQRSGRWRAECKTGKQTQDSRNRRTLGYYATDERAARARHKYICDEGFEQFNTMDVLDDATDLMVPRERKKPPEKKKRPPPAPFAVVDRSTSKRGRMRTATKR